MAAKVVKRIIRPIESFLAMESASGIMLMVATAIALVWANSPWHEAYEHFIHTKISVGVADWKLSYGLSHWVNDGLMVVFFFVVGLEIKRELIVGELSTPKKAALPMFAALGGMIFPAGIYFILNGSQGAGAAGWGIPMATDIAFAVGILTLMSRKVPFSLKVFLLALAIVDDLGAVLVIAFFYTEQIAPQALGLAGLGLGLMYVFRFTGVRKHLVYILIGIFVWLCVLKSGVHATVAGVLIGLITPIAPLHPLTSLPDKFVELARNFAETLRSQLTTEGNAKSNFTCLSHTATHQLDEIQHFVTEASNPLERFIHLLHPWVSFFIMPVFALVNAGVNIQGVDFGTIIESPITLGILFGLLVGKPLGVGLLSYAAVKLKLAELPQGVTWFHIIAVGFLAGIGFTMALFISSLALGGGGLELYSKLGILMASALAGIVGSALLMCTKDQPQRNR